MWAASTVANCDDSPAAVARPQIDFSAIRTELGAPLEFGAPALAEAPYAWVLAALPTLPATTASTTRRANEVERAAIESVEAVLLTDRIGAEFDTVVVEAHDDGRAGAVALDDPAVRARCDGQGLVPGTRLRVRLAEADPATRKVQFIRA